MACLNWIPRSGSGNLTAAVSLGMSYYIGLAFLTILVIVLLVYVYRVWAEIHEDIESDTPGDLLDTFEDAHAAGELDEEELRRVRELLLQDNPDRLEKSSPPVYSVNSETTEDSSSIGDTSPRPPVRDEPPLD